MNSYIGPSENLKFESKFLFSSHVDRSPVKCSLVKIANSLDNMLNPPVKAYLSRSSNLIFKYLGWIFTAKCNSVFFLDCSFKALVQFEFTYIKWNNMQMGFANLESVNIVMSNK